MSVVTVQVGQCGNQLGASLFQALHEHSAAAVATTTPENISSSTHDADASTTASTTYNAAASACRRSFFRNNGTMARAVIVDTEPKVIQRIVTEDSSNSSIGTQRPRSKKIGSNYGAKSSTSRGGEARHGGGGGDGAHGWSYDSGTQVCCHAQGGAANNWAYGYHGHGAKFAEACLEGVRREVERCDRLTGLCVLHSAAGGTGSGLGTYLTEVGNWRGGCRRVSWLI